MNDAIYIKSGELGNREEMPKLRYDKEKGCELGIRTDEKALYIGTELGNVRLCGENDSKRVDALLTDISELSARIEAMSVLVESITARLDALEAKSE